MADRRAFANFDVGYLENPKMLDVLDASSIALCMHLASVLYCAQHLTDGIVPAKAMQRKVGGTDADAQILIDAGLWHEPGHDCPACPQPPQNRLYVHDFLEHNRSSRDAKRVSDRAKRAAESRWSGDATSNAVSNASSNAASNAKKERKKDTTEANASVESARKRATPARRATRIPEGWTPSPELAESMTNECPFVDQRAEHRKFVDYWTAKSGAGATKTDWDATYRNWIRRAAESAPRTGNRATDRMMAGYNAMAGYQGPIDDPWQAKELEQ